MSVILFSAEELGNAGSYLVASPLIREEAHKQVAEWLAEYSVGNAWAYSHQYGGELEPASVEEIRKAINPRQVDKRRARSTILLLAYNGATNAGRETRLAGYFEALANLLNMAFGRLTDDVRHIMTK